MQKMLAAAFMAAMTTAMVGAAGVAFAGQSQVTLSGTASGFVAPALMTCADVLAANPSATDGVYAIDPADNGGSINVLCDMTTDGGGWTIVGRAPSNTLTTGFGSAYGTAASGEYGISLAAFSGVALNEIRLQYASDRTGMYAHGTVSGSYTADQLDDSYSATIAVAVTASATYYNNSTPCTMWTRTVGWFGFLDAGTNSCAMIHQYGDQIHGMYHAIDLDTSRPVMEIAFR